MKKTHYLAGIILCSATLPALADECTLTIDSNDAMQFDRQELSVPASCQEVTLTLTHSGSLAKDVMGHNWVLSKADDMQAIATAGMSAGADNGYLPVADERVLAHTEVIGGGESSTITFSTASMSSDEAYGFFCSFPGHIGVMKGTFALTE